jgi:hypothetical protein
MMGGSASMPSRRPINAAYAALVTLVLGPPLGILPIAAVFMVYAGAHQLLVGEFPEPDGPSFIGVIKAGLVLTFYSYVFGGIQAFAASAYVYFRLSWRQSVGYAEALGVAASLGLVIGFLLYAPAYRTAEDLLPNLAFFTVPSLISAFLLRLFGGYRGWIRR